MIYSVVSVGQTPFEASANPYIQIDGLIMSACIVFNELCYAEDGEWRRLFRSISPEILSNFNAF